MYFFLYNPFIIKLIMNGGNESNNNFKSEFQNYEYQFFHIMSPPAPSQNQNQNQKFLYKKAKEDSFKVISEIFISDFSFEETEAISDFSMEFSKIKRRKNIIV
jgi:hypothetical protein